MKESQQAKPNGEAIHSSTPQASLMLSRSFSENSEPENEQEQLGEAPSLQAQFDRANRLGHRFETLSILSSPVQREVEPNPSNDRQGLAHELSHWIQDSSQTVQQSPTSSVTPDLQAQRGDEPDQEEQENLEQRLDDIERRYREMIQAARGRGANVAADNLQRFLDGTGGTKVLPVDWLRGFNAVTSAERVNQQRFENSLKELAAEMQPGQSRSFSDYWERTFTASAQTELYYASGTSTIRSTGSFQLSRDGSTVTITGSVDHHWFDPYDWHAGLVANIPGFGTVSDEDALLLQQHRSAKPFEMEADWQQTVSGTVTVRDLWFNGADFSWSGP